MKNFTLLAFFVATLWLSPSAYAQTVIWEEDFEGENNGATVGDDANNHPAGVDWTTSYGGGGTFSVQNNEFRAENTGRKRFGNRR